jgi:hypothetical protein
MGQIHHAGPTRAAKLAHPSSPPSAAAKWARVPVEPTCRPRPSVRPHLSGDFSPISPAWACAVVVGNPPLPRPVPSHHPRCLPTSLQSHPACAHALGSPCLVAWSSCRLDAAAQRACYHGRCATVVPEDKPLDDTLAQRSSLAPAVAALRAPPSRRVVHSHTHRAPA